MPLSLKKQGIKAFFNPFFIDIYMYLFYNVQCITIIMPYCGLAKKKREFQKMENEMQINF